jgi:hypothetical protein
MYNAVPVNMDFKFPSTRSKAQQAPSGFVSTGQPFYSNLVRL